MAKNITVGFIRPIDPVNEFKSTHFSALENKIAAAVRKFSNDEFKFVSNGLVSESEGVSDINRTIVQNIFYSDIIIGIMSGLNANVMFEIGLRLSQKKPTILICDDKTQLPFDTSTFYTIEYPRSLDFEAFDLFLEKFKRKLLGTWKNFKKDNGASTFIAQYENASIINTSVNEITLNEATDKLAYMLDLMTRKYIAFDPDDVWDDFNFEHDVSKPISLRNRK